MLSFASDKAKLFPKNFFKNSNLDDSGISLPAFPFRTNLTSHDIHLTSTLVGKAITNLDLPKMKESHCKKNSSKKVIKEL